MFDEVLPRVVPAPEKIRRPALTSMSPNPVSVSGRIHRSWPPVLTRLKLLPWSVAVEKASMGAMSQRLLAAPSVVLPSSTRLVSPSPLKYTARLRLLSAPWPSAPTPEAWTVPALMYWPLISRVAPEAMVLVPDPSTLVLAARRVPALMYTGADIVVLSGLVH